MLPRREEWTESSVFPVRVRWIFVANNPIWLFDPLWLSCLLRPSFLHVVIPAKARIHFFICDFTVGVSVSPRRGGPNEPPWFLCG